jgi:hypothetical protein
MNPKMFGNEKPNNSSRNPEVDDTPSHGAAGPDACLLKTGEGASAVPARKGRSLRTMPTRVLARMHGAEQGKHPEVADELRARGYSSEMLRQVEWDYSQRKWTRNAKEAGHRKAKENSARRKRVRGRKHRRKRERRAERSVEWWRQEQRKISAKVDAGFEIVGEHYDPAARDDSCPF